MSFLIVKPDCSRMGIEQQPDAILRRLEEGKS
jgi:hypothetical protein